jgi:hypothetical protein
MEDQHCLLQIFFVHWHLYSHVRKTLGRTLPGRNGGIILGIPMILIHRTKATECVIRKSSDDSTSVINFAHTNTTQLTRLMQKNRDTQSKKGLAANRQNRRYLPSRVDSTMSISAIRQSRRETIYNRLLSPLPMKTTQHGSKHL